MGTGQGRLGLEAGLIPAPQPRRREQGRSVSINRDAQLAAVLAAGSGAGAAISDPPSPPPPPLSCSLNNTIRRSRLWYGRRPARLAALPGPGADTGQPAGARKPLPTCPLLPASSGLLSPPRRP